MDRHQTVAVAPTPAIVVDPRGNQYLRVLRQLQGVCGGSFDLAEQAHAALETARILGADAIQAGRIVAAVVAERASSLAKLHTNHSTQHGLNERKRSLDLADRYARIARDLRAVASLSPETTS